MAAAHFSLLSVCSHTLPEALGIPRRHATSLISDRRPFGLDPTRLLSSSPILPKRNEVLGRLRSVSGGPISEALVESRSYEFYDTTAEVELKLDIGKLDVTKSSDIFVDVDESSLLVRVKASGTLITLMETNCLFERIKPSETIWYIDEDQLVISLKKYDTELKWPDLAESWESLTKGILQLLKGTSIFIVGDSTEINETVADVLASGIGYIPLYTSDLLERYAQQPIQSWVISEGADSVAQAEGAVIESLSRYDFVNADEASAKEETRRHIQDGSLAYSNADVVMKLGGWDSDRARVVAQACLSALKQLTLSDKQLTGKKSLYVRLGCRGDWPDIAPPGWDPSSAVNPDS
ncbi:hypothetical protein ZIOFF_036425 [Zingiber officinale]|uniref:CS domain-containing protein n=1 Tax=Zingiber officinale TaxID=94328 RepID=A0A8J5GBJ2_ZINOF|nr:hypothetical protein ZIOFF_036425 [Zingiber officinale]